MAEPAKKAARGHRPPEDATDEQSGAVHPDGWTPPGEGEADPDEVRQQEQIAQFGVASSTPGNTQAGRHPESGPRSAPAAQPPTKVLIGAPGEAGGKEAKTVSDLGDSDDGSTTVVLKENVYEQHDLPGTDRKGTRLLFHKGQRVSKAELAAVDEGIKAQASEHKEQSGSDETK